ncbi:tail protein X [Peribacillus phoenicis]|uniref:phage tail protein n=1 Tax=unclassified Peribacillus TaxID=2675266 RepID=UPI0039A3EE33
MKTYTTILGDTFDKIAFELLGSEYLFPLLLAENQQYREVLMFSAGVVLNIPEVETDDYENIPEWMTGDFVDETGDYAEEETAEVALEGVDS